MSRERKLSGDYEVGYGKPPKTTQFKKGFSGNWKGRPPKPTGFIEMAKEELSAPVVIKENGRPKRVNYTRALLKRLKVDAAAGDPKAIRELLKLAASLESKEPVEPKVKMGDSWVHPWEKEANDRVCRDARVVKALAMIGVVIYKKEKPMINPAYLEILFESMPNLREKIELIMQALDNIEREQGTKKRKLLLSAWTPA